MEQVVVQSIAKLSSITPVDSSRKFRLLYTQIRHDLFNNHLPELRSSLGLQTQKPNRIDTSLISCHNSRPSATILRQSIPDSRANAPRVRDSPTRPIRPLMSKQPRSDIDIDPRFTGRVLAPPDTSQTSDAWWDSNCYSGPVVVPGPLPTSGGGGGGADPGTPAAQGWRMYYYGRDTDMWRRGVKPPPGGVPTGRIGLAVSEDGIMWDRCRGPLPGGAVFDPSEDADAFDAVQVAVGDVIRVKLPTGTDNNTGRDVEEGSSSGWKLFYLGSGTEEGDVPGFPGKMAGVRMRPGVANSEDGVNFVRDSTQPILELGEPGEFDDLGIVWPRVIPPSGDPGIGQRWYMTYHTRERGPPPSYSVGVATSDDGENWVKYGRVLGRGAPGAWDEGGVSIRHVVKFGSEYLMFYEGCDFKFNFAIGLATSSDGFTWRKDEEVGLEPGGPVFAARKGEDVWDNVIVAVPYVVVMPDNTFRMYYLGVGKMKGQDVSQRSIGLAISVGNDFRRWKRHGE